MSASVPLQRGRWHIAARVAASLLGSWVFVWGLLSLGVLLLMAAGLPYGDAQTLGYLLAFLVFLGSFLWAFAARSLMRVWALLLGGGALMSGLAWALSRQA